MKIREHLVIDDASTLFSALIAFESLSIATFGSLYSTYAAYMMQGGAPIIRVLRALNIQVSVVLLITALLAIYILFSSVFFLAMPKPILAALSLVALFPPWAASWLAWNTWKDAH